LRFNALTIHCIVVNSRMAYKPPPWQFGRPGAPSKLLVRRAASG